MGNFRFASFGASLVLSGVLGLSTAGCSRSEGAKTNVKTEAKERSELLREGDVAPDFETVAHDGSAFRLSALLGKAVVLYFYPKDGTPGCSAEADAFRDEAAAFEAADAVIVGVSSDDAESHRSFATEHGLPFLLLPDTEHTVAKIYGIGSFLGMMSRITYLVGPDGRIAKIYPDVSPSEHARQVLDDLKQLTKRP